MRATEQDAVVRTLENALIILEASTPHRVDPANVIYSRAQILRAIGNITRALRTIEGTV